MTMDLVKKTQKEWECSRCIQKINIGSSMIRNSIHRWKTEIYCLECAKSDIEGELRISKEGYKVFEKYDKDNMIRKSYENAIIYYENVLKIMDVS